MGDFELLKDVPGYKAILKIVLKSQIQLLIDQLSKHTGEESFILTANAGDGAQSMLGSSLGKDFMGNHREIKTEFLGYCLKSAHGIEEKVSYQLNSRTKTRTHPYAKNYTSSNRNQNPAQYYERKDIPEFKNKQASEKIYYHETGKKDRTLSQDSHTPPLAEVENNISNGYDSKRGDGSLHSRNIESQDIYYDKNHSQAASDCIQASGDYDQASSDVDRCDDYGGSHDVIVKQEQEESDDVEITDLQLGQQSMEDQSSEDQHYPFNDGSYDDNAARHSLDTGTLDISNASTNGFSCGYCGKVFQHNSWLMRHVRGHTGEKPYECHVCGKRFTRSGTMKIHMLTHRVK